MKIEGMKTEGMKIKGKRGRRWMKVGRNERRKKLNKRRRMKIEGMKIEGMREKEMDEDWEE